MWCSKPQGAKCNTKQLRGDSDVPELGQCLRPFNVGLRLLYGVRPSWVVQVVH